MKYFYKIILFFISLILLFVVSTKLEAQVCDTCYIQCDTCSIDPSASFLADFRDNPDSTWEVTGVTRSGTCCGDDSDDCMRVKIYLHPDIDIIEFDCVGGAAPPTTNFTVYVNCVVHGTVQDTLCVTGVDSLCLVYCKPGGNPNNFTITVSSQVQASPDIAVSNGCEALMYVNGLDSGSIVWYSIAPGDSADYNSYLQCLTPACDSVLVSPTGTTFPESVTYVVTGNITSQCGNLPISDTVVVYFYDSSGVYIEPDPVFICNGGDSATMEAMPFGGAPPYSYLWSTGDTSKTIKVGAGGWYSVEVSDTSSCPPNIDSIFVTELASDITCNAGNDTTICANSPTVYLNGTVQIASGGVWLTDGLGTFADDSTLSTTYDATNDVAAADTSITIYLTTTGNGGCPPAIDSMIVTIVPTPSVEIQPDGPLTVCANNPAVVLNGTIVNGIQGLWTTSNPADPGTFSPNDSVTNGNVIYYPSDSDTANHEVWVYFQSIGACGNVKDSVYIEYTPAPWVDAGADTTICNTVNSYQLNGSSSTGFGVWSGGSGPGQFSNVNDLSATYTFTATDTANGQAVLVLTSQNNGNCNPVTDTVVITLAAPPVITVTGDSTICQGDNISLVATITGGSGDGIWVKSSPGVPGTFAPDQQSLIVTYTPSADDITNGYVTLSYVAINIPGGCPSASANITVDIIPPPIVDAGPDTTVCENNTNITLFGNLTYANSGVWSTNGSGTFSPSDTVVSGVNYIPSAGDLLADSVILTLTSTDGCDSITDSLTVTFSPAPVVNAGNDTVLCNGVMTVQLNASFTGSFTQYYWYKYFGSGTFNDSTLLNPIYTLNDADTANGYVDLIFAVELNGCNPVTDTVRILVGDTTTNVYINPSDTSICSNEWVSINDFGVSSTTNTGLWTSSGDGYFMPDDTATAPPVSYYPGPADTTAGSVTLYFQSTYSCDYDYDSLLVTITSGPWVNAGTDDTICSGDTYTLSGSSSTGSGQWKTGAGGFNPGNTSLNATYTPDASELNAGFVELVLESTNNGGCAPAYDTMRLTIVTTPVVNITAPDSVCRNSVIALDGDTTGGQANILWTTNSTSGYFSPADTALDPSFYPNGQYTEDSLVFNLYAITNTACPDDSAQVVVYFKPTPVVDAGPDDSVCKNNLNLYLGNASYSFADSILWQNIGFNGSFDDPTVLDPNYTANLTDTVFGGVWLTLTAYSACEPVIDSLWLVFNAPAIVNAGPDQYICESNNSVSLNGSISGNTTTGGWYSLGDGAFVPDTSSLSTNYVFGASDTNSVTIILQSTGNGNCNPVTDTVVVYLTDSAAVNAGPDDTVCANNAFAYLNGQISGIPGTGIWTILQGDGNFAPSDTTLSALYVPDTIYNLHTLVLQSTNACNNTSDTMDIVVTPSPVVAAGEDITVCQGESSVALSGTISGGASAGQWSTNGSGTFDNNLALNTNYNIKYPEDSVAGVIEIYLTSTDTGDCYAVTDTLLLFLGDNPVAGFSFTSPICQFDTVYFTDNSSVASSDDSVVSWYWDFGNGNTGSVQNPSTIYNSSGSFTVVQTATTARGCTDVDSAGIYISEVPGVNFTVSAPYCDNDSVEFTNTTIYTIPVNTWEWLLGNGDTSNLFEPPPVLYDTTGIYTVTLTATNDSSCAADTSISFFINASPVANFYADNVCIGDSTQFYDTSTSADTIIAWEWEFGDGGTSSLQNPSHVFSTTDTFDVQLIIHTNQCSDTITHEYFVWALPEILTAGDTLCPQDTMFLSTNMPDSCTFYWDFGDGSGSSTLPTPWHIYDNPDQTDTTYTAWVAVTNPNGCEDTAYLNVVVRPIPVVDAGPNDTVCANNSIVTLNGQVSGYPGTGQWIVAQGNGTFSPSDTSLNATYVPDTTSNLHALVLQATNACEAVTDTMQVIITPSPIVDAGEDIAVCQGEVNVSLSGSITGGASSGIWTTNGSGYFDDSLSLSTIYHFSYPADSSSGGIEIYLTAIDTGDCFSVTDTLQVSFGDQPIADFSFITPNCQYDTVSFTDNSTIVSTTDSIVSWYWDFGDGTSDTLQNPSTTYSNDGNYTVTLTVTTAMGCVAIDSANIVITESPGVNFTVNAPYCDNDSVDFTNTTTYTIPVNTWDWQLGNGNTSNLFEPPPMLYDTSGVYTVTLTATNDSSCTADTSISFFINASPVANFYADNVCIGDSTQFYDTSTSADTIIAWEWEFGDGGTSSLQNPSHVFSTTDTFDVQLIIHTNQCSDTIMQQYYVWPDPVIISGGDTVCNNDSIQFTTNMPDNCTFIWNFGDGSDTSMATNPVHNFNNTSGSDTTFYVSVIVINPNGCVDTTTVEVLVHPDPYVNFIPSPAAACPGTLVQFQNLSPDVNSFLWDFGDGVQDSTNLNPGHIFSNDTNINTIFPVSLSITDSYGCKNTRIINYTVYGIPQHTSIIEPDSVCPLEQFSLGASPKSYYFEWHMGDGTIKNGDTINHQYGSLQLPHDTTFTVTLVAVNNNGCRDTSYQNVVMHPFPFPGFILDTASACSPSEVSFQNNSTTPPAIDSTYYGIDFNNDLVPDTLLPYPINSYTFTNEDTAQKTYNVILTAISNRGCVKRKSASITIYPELDVDFQILPTDSGCSPLNVNMVNLTQNAQEYTWHLGGELNTNTNPYHTFTNSSTTTDSVYNVWLEAISDYGCEGVSDTTTVKIFKTPIANFAIVPTAGCSPLEATFNNNSIGADSNYWDFGNGNTSWLDNPLPQTYFNTTGDIIDYDTVTLISYNNDGCSDTVSGTVKVYPAVEAVIYTDTVAGCHPLTINFSTDYTDSVSYHWEFGDGYTSDLQNPGHEYINNSDTIRHRTVILKTTSINSCMDYDTTMISVYPLPKAYFSVSPTQGCTPLDINLTDYTINAEDYYFIFNGDSTASSTFINSTQLVNNTQHPEVQDVELWVQSEYSCWNYSTNTVEVNPRVDANFDISTEVSCPPLFVQFDNLSDTLYVQDYNWNFGDNTTSTQTNPSHTYSNSSYYNTTTFFPSLSVKSIFGCFSDTIIDTVRVYPKPNADFIVQDSLIIFHPPSEQATFENTSQCSECNYYWTFGDGDSVENNNTVVPHSYTDYGNYRIVLYAINEYNCIDSTIGNIFLELSDPYPKIKALTPIEGCVPFYVQLADSSKGHNPDFNKWDINGNYMLHTDEITGEDSLYIGAPDENYSITLIISNGKDTASTQLIIEAHETPHADFELASNVLDIPEDKLICINTSIGGEEYYWDFGDGETSDEFSPVHQYDEEGSYDIILITSTEHGCADTVKKKDAVAAESKCKIIMPNAFTPNPNGPSGGHYDPDVPNINNDIFHPVYEDIRNYKLEIFNRWGEIIFVSNDINVGWDGYYKGSPVEQDVYVWKITAECYSGQTISRMGSVTVLW